MQIILDSLRIETSDSRAHIKMWRRKLVIALLVKFYCLLWLIL